MNLITASYALGRVCNFHFVLDIWPSCHTLAVKNVQSKLNYLLTG